MARVDEVMAELESLGTAQNRKVFPRHGIPEPMFGVNYSNLDKLARRIGRDHALAEALWATGNHDARILATKVADPAALTSRAADTWLKAVRDHVAGEAFAGVVAESPVAASRAKAWRDRKGEWPAAVGWAVVARMALQPDGLGDDEAKALIDQIRREIHDRPNRVRYEMNNALIALGSRNPTLLAAAVDAGTAIGPVHVDHGQTGCTTPDAVAYLARIEARRKAKGSTGHIRGVGTPAKR